jgi:L-2-hydroxyglutarate oxidase LhgO
MERVDVTVIGAGIVGLATAWQVARSGQQVLLLERHESFGRETSSRNSEVIHAGIYYPAGSLKGRFCIEGNRMLYRLCEQYHIPHLPCGKLIVAVTEEEEEQLEGLKVQGEENGAERLELIGQDRIRQLEPAVHARAALHCPTSGVVDTHQLMKFYETSALQQGVEIAYNVEVQQLTGDADGWLLSVCDTAGEAYEFQSRVVVNSGGLNSGNLAAAAGIDQDAAGYRINYCKGMYFRIGNGKETLTSSLIYPVPPRPGSVGIHTCPDNGGGMRLGPCDVWVDEIEYSVDEQIRTTVHQAVQPFLPFLKPEDLQPDSAGIHPKVQQQGEPMHDYIVCHEVDRGMPGLINLIGIESPGVTASPALGRYVSEMIAGIL